MSLRQSAVLTNGPYNNVFPLDITDLNISTEPNLVSQKKRGLVANSNL